MVQVYGLLQSAQHLQHSAFRGLPKMSIARMEDRITKDRFTIIRFDFPRSISYSNITPLIFQNTQLHLLEVKKRLLFGKKPQDDNALNTYS